MSFQIVCDNCGSSVMIKNHDPCHRMPENWEPIYQSAKKDDVTKHLCPECISAKNQAKWNMQDKVRQAEEAALEARKVKA